MPQAPFHVLLVGMRYHENYRHTLSLGYLKSYLDSLPELKGRVSTTLIERNVHEDLKSLATAVVQESPDVVGFSCYIWNMARILELCRVVKKLCPRARIVLGGPEVGTRDVETMREAPEVDAVVCGEGELTFAELVSAWAAGRPSDGIRGLVHRKGADPVQAPERPLIPDLSIIPSPYLNGIFEVRDGDCLALESSRGCPLQCRFCDWQNYQKTRWFPQQRFLDEVAAVERQASGVYYFVTDADIFTSKDRAAFLLEGIDRITTNKSFHWHFQTYLANINEELAKRLNSYKFSLGSGIESIQPKALRRMLRGFSRRGVERSIGYLKQHAPAVSIHLQLIHALPDDNLAGYRQSLDWALAMKTDSLFLPRALALPGAEFGKHPERYGITAMKVPPYKVLYTDTFPAEEVEAADWLAFRTLNLHKIGMLRRPLELVGVHGVSDRPESEVPEPGPAAEAPAPAEGSAAAVSARSPWVDLYERFYARLEKSSEFFIRQSKWYRSLNALGQIMNQEPMSWEEQPVADRLRIIAAMADFARDELARAGREGEWPALEHFLRCQEARLLWEDILGAHSFQRALGHMFQGIPMNSERIRWVGWQRLQREQALCPRAAMNYLVSTVLNNNYDVCETHSCGLLHVEERYRLDKWSALAAAPGETPFLATVLSNVYWAVPAELRVPLLRAVRESGSGPSRLILWADSVGLSPLEFLSSEAARGTPQDTADAGARIRADLAAAGWESILAPLALSASGALNGKVTWTLVVAQTAGARRPASRERATAEAI